MVSYRLIHLFPPQNNFPSVQLTHYLFLSSPHWHQNILDTKLADNAKSRRRASYMYRVTIYSITWKTQRAIKKTSTLTVTLLNKFGRIRRIVTAITVVPKESRVPFGFNCWQSSLFGAVRTCFDHVLSKVSGFSWERILFLESACVQYGDANLSSNWRCRKSFLWIRLGVLRI